MTCRIFALIYTDVDQFSLANPPWVGTMSTSESWGVNGHTARYTSSVSVVSQCKLVSGWGPRKRRSVPPTGSWAQEGLYFTLPVVIKPQIGAANWNWKNC